MIELSSDLAKLSAEREKELVALAVELGKEANEVFVKVLTALVPDVGLGAATTLIMPYVTALSMTAAKAWKLGYGHGRDDEANGVPLGA